MNPSPMDVWELEELELNLTAMGIPDGCNIIVGQSQFIKTVEDIF